VCAGIDTGKDKLDMAVAGLDEDVTVANDAAGWRQLADHCKQHRVAKVGIEATGGYERGVVRHLQAAGLRVAVLQPMQVRAYARLKQQRAKSDRIDARLIAACVQSLGDAARPAADARFDAVADLLTFIEQIEEDIARIKTRLEHVGDARLRRIDEGDIKRLCKRREQEQTRLIAALRGDDELGRRFDLVCSIPGCGERTALSIVVRLPELGEVSREAAAALAGLAPFVHESGTFKGERHIGGGRARLRRALYMAALPASFRWNPALVELYRRLRARGKSHSCALVACARKLLIMANAVVARGTPWEVRPATA
jgi:transposase